MAYSFLWAALFGYLATRRGLPGQSLSAVDLRGRFRMRFARILIAGLTFLSSIFTVGVNGAFAAGEASVWEPPVRIPAEREWILAVDPFYGWLPGFNGNVQVFGGSRVNVDVSVTDILERLGTYVDLLDGLYMGSGELRHGRYGLQWDLVYMNVSGSTILITGGTGSFGNRVAAHLLKHATGGEIFVRKAPACTIGKLAEAICNKYSSKGTDHPIHVTGIRPGEKLHEILVNEYEMQRVTEEDLFYAIHPEYNVPEHRTEQPLGTEYTSANTCQFDSASDIKPLLDQMGETELYI